ncbi:EAL domain-containing protein [Marinospirillum sp. MEB164]|uniref:EAL domain-containing protein n=1 Tax=Marinospirillum alkalitolerans TaxID=3123374 RepID=A0ABW8PX35_9GAMM
MKSNEDDLLLFADEASITAPLMEGPAWRILIVDDDIDVHQATKMAFFGLEVLGRSIECMSAYSAAEARQLLEQAGPFACVFLDVVMEEEQAGLKLVGYIRDQLQDQQVRIVLRTGQPGYAPELEVIKKYDINDYKHKSELSRTRLVTALIASLRSYQQIRMLEQSRTGLAMIIKNAPNLFLRHSAQDFAQGVLLQLCSLLDIDENGFICCHEDSQDQQVRILAGAGHYSHLIGQSVQDIEDLTVREAILDAMRSKQNVICSDYMLLYIQSPRQDELVVRIETHRPLTEMDIRLIELFSINIAVGFENAQLFEQTEFQALHDTLTLLPNRHACLEACERLIQDQTPFAVLMMDVDNFQSINDGLGYGVGDAMLKKIAVLLKQHFHQAALIARLSADTFSVLLPQASLEQINPWVEAFKEATDQGLDVEGYDLPLSFTLGLAFYPGQGETAKALLQNVSIAMKHGKNTRRGLLSLFDHAFERALQQRLSVAQELRYSIERGELEVYFQPQHCLQTQSLMGAEALLRWRRAGQLVSPIEFIEAAESTGLIVPLGAWVLETACHEQQRWWRETGQRLTVAVNVSMRQLIDPHFLDQVDQALQKTGITPEDLELEITESMMMEDPAALQQLIAGLRDRGIKVAMDDFGTGYSSLSHLQQLPLDKLKIDRAFISGLEQHKEDRLLVEMMINLGHMLGHIVIAEGVETQEQQQILCELGCDRVQGYFYSPPLAAEAWQAYLLAHAQPE